MRIRDFFGLRKQRRNADALRGFESRQAESVKREAVGFVALVSKGARKATGVVLIVLGAPFALLLSGTTTRRRKSRLVRAGTRLLTR